MNKIIISCIQMDVFTGDVIYNLKKAEKLSEKAIKRESNFIIFPEMFATGFAYPDLIKIGKEHSYNIMHFFKSLAIKANAYIIGGSIPEIENNEVFNTTIIFDPQGRQIGKYRKINLFPLTEEDKNFAPGKNINTIKTNYGKIGVIICYDIRFPDLSHKLAQDGVQIIFVPAQFPHPRQDHWITLLKARAIENQVFIAGCNRIGGKNIEHCGTSLIIDPNGKVIVQASESKEEVITEAIDLNYIEKARKILPMPAS